MVSNWSIIVCLIWVVLGLGRWDWVLHCMVCGWRSLELSGSRVEWSQFGIQVSKFVCGLCMRNATAAELAD